MAEVQLHIALILMPEANEGTSRAMLFYGEAFEHLESEQDEEMWMCGWLSLICLAAWTMVGHAGFRTSVR
jgi:hypothetical protein